jgi:hypothetical protein
MAKLTVIKKLPRTAGAILTKAHHIATSMQHNLYFPRPPVPIATFLEHIATAEAAQAAMRTRLNTARTDRNAKLAVVLRDLDQLAIYVQQVASKYPPEERLAIVASAGMEVQGYRKAGKATFRVTPGRTSGSVILDALHPGIVASFDWQYSADGKRWIDAPSTTQSKTTISGLTPGATYHFRYRALTHAGKGDWSEPFVLMVV